MNYNTLRNKPTINYKEIIGDNTVSDVGGITEEEFDDLLDTDLASYYTKAEIDELFSRSFVYREKSGSIVTFDCPSSITTGISEVTSKIVAVQAGNGDPSPTNVRPISGWSAVNVYDRGVNVWDEQWEVGSISDASGQDATNSNYRRSKNYISVKANKKYYFNVPSKYGTTYRFYQYKQNKDYIGIKTVDSDGTFETDNDCAFIRFRIATTEDYTNDISINYPSTDTDYHAYNGQVYTTTLKDGQGNPLMCYGGQLTNENGVQSLVLTHGYIASYNGETLPSTWISDRDVYAPGTTPTIGAEVVYLLETPLQITQDSLTIASQSGVNNIWCDSGDITVKALDKIIQE